MRFDYLVVFLQLLDLGYIRAYRYYLGTIVDDRCLNLKVQAPATTLLFEDGDILINLVFCQIVPKVLTFNGLMHLLIAI